MANAVIYKVCHFVGHPGPVKTSSAQPILYFRDWTPGLLLPTLFVLD